ncbi:ComEA family DNA-binding protein [Lentibacillus lipolyticus]|nr:ComEA family DNA-binding protein [Lentibacillus lipolyticus]
MDSNQPAAVTKQAADPEKEMDKTGSDSGTTGIPQVLVVDVKGEVADPGVYKANPDDRVHDVIKMAGGFTRDADQTTVNLAQKVQDEMVIMVPGDTDNTNQASAMLEGGTEKVRINYADQTALEELNGIGPSKAQAIIQYREENGLFQAAEDLLAIPGIGEKTLESLKEDIQIP